MESVVKSQGERGVLDTWPVRSHGNGELSSVPPKPQLLQNLETHLNKELRLLGCPSVGPSELRLQAHREVFDFLVEKFTTYKPLLSSIKNEYDLFIAYQSELIRELLPLKTKMLTLKDGYEKKIIEIKEDDKSQDERIRHENRKLRIEIKQLKTEEISYQKQISLLQEEMSTIYEKYRFEKDARKLLIAERSNREDDPTLQTDEQKRGDTDSKDEDPVLLKLNLNKVREDLQDAKKRINEILADYGDVVPRNEFEATEQSRNEALNELDTVKSQYSLLMKEHSTLMSVYKELEKKMEKSAEELDHLKGSATPRPDWDRCGEFIEGGTEKWAELSEGRSSDELVDILLAKLAGVEVSEITRHEVFQGQGTGPLVPRYLQKEGEITNRKIKQKELDDILNAFWEHWLLNQSSEGTQSIDESLYQYLLVRNNGEEEKAIEDGYNLQDACGRYRHVTHVGVFGLIINGEMNESVYVNWITLQVTLAELLKGECNDDNEVTITQLEHVLKNEFPSKSVSMIQSLIERAEDISKSTDNSNHINILQLLSKGPQNEPNSFVLLLLEQIHEQMKAFTTELKKVAGDKMEVNMSEANEAIQQFDPNRTKLEIHELLTTLFPTFNNNDENAASNNTIPVSKLIEFVGTNLK